MLALPRTHGADHIIWPMTSGSRVGDVEPKIGSVIESRKDEVAAVWPRERQPNVHTIDGNAVDFVCLHPEALEQPRSKRVVQGHRMAATAAFLFGSGDLHLAKLLGNLQERQQSGCADAVVICKEDSHGGMQVYPFRRHRRFRQRSR